MKEASTRGSEESELCSVWVWLDRDSGGKGERAERKGRTRTRGTEPSHCVKQLAWAPVLLADKLPRPVAMSGQRSRFHSMLSLLCGTLLVLSSPRSTPNCHYFLVVAIYMTNMTVSMDT